MPPKRACKYGPRKNGKCPPKTAASKTASNNASKTAKNASNNASKTANNAAASKANASKLRIHVTVSAGTLSKADIEFIRTRIEEAQVAMVKELEAMYSNDENADKAAGGFLARLKAAATSRPAIVGAMLMAIAGGAVAAHKTGYLTAEQARVLAEFGRTTGRRVAESGRALRNRAAAKLAEGWAWARKAVSAGVNSLYRKLRRPPPPPPKKSWLPWRR